MLVGLLPAAGRALRLRPYRSPKELIPLLLAGAEGAVPTPVCHFALDALRVAGAARAFLVLSDDKLEVLRVLEDGRDYGLPLAYLVQPEPLGLTHVVRLAAPWLGEADVAFALPDTITFPEDALARLVARREATGADVMLGVFPTEEAARLAPVRLDAGGRVLALWDKPAAPEVHNTWGLVVWSARFTRFCAEWDERRTEAEGKLTHAIEAAMGAGLAVHGLEFPGGVFRDVGTREGLADALRVLAARGLLFS